jgi:hypothetical protein
MTGEIVYAPDGMATGVRQTWTFDDMYLFGMFATHLDAKVKGQFRARRARTSLRI